MPSSEAPDRPVVQSWRCIFPSASRSSNFLGRPPRPILFVRSCIKRLSDLFCATLYRTSLGLARPVHCILLGGADTMNLATSGVDGIVRHTAGHTPGSVSVELPSQDALVGDLI